MESRAKQTCCNWVKGRKGNIAIAIICNILWKHLIPKECLFCIKWIINKRNYWECCYKLLSAFGSGSLIRLHMLLQTLAAGRKIGKCIPIAWIKEWTILSLSWMKILLLSYTAQQLFDQFADSEKASGQYFCSEENVSKYTQSNPTWANLQSIKAFIIGPITTVFEQYLD